MKIKFKKRENNNINNIVKEKKNFKLFFFIASFVVLLISFTRIPYVGEFFDAVFFSFIFGWSKYIIYLYLFVLLICYFAKKIKKPMYSKRAFFLLLVTSFLFSCLFSSIFNYININNKDYSSTIFINYLDYWKSVVFPLNYGFNPFIYDNRIFVDGGILGTSVCYLSNIIVIILSLLGITVVYLSLANKHREKIFNFFRKKIKNKQVLQEFDNFNGNKTINENDNETKEEHIIDDSYLNSIIKDWKKQYLNLEKNSINRNLDTNKIKENILQFFKDNNISFIKTSANDIDSRLTIDFLMDDETYANFKNISNLFKIAVGNLEYNTIYENNTLSITFVKSSSLDNVLLKKNLLINYTNPFDVSFLTLNNTPLIINLRKNSFIGVFDPKDKNINNLINNIIYSLSWTYKVQQLKIFYLSTKNISLSSFKSPNFNKVDMMTTKDATVFLKKLLKEIKELQKEFKKKNVNNIYTYNSLVNNPIENKVILINDFNQMISINPEIKTYINEIIELAPNFGINIITFDKSSDAITYNNFKYNISLLFKSSIDVSKKILNDSIAINLHERNNAILFNAIADKKFEVYVPFINENEEKIIISSLQKCFDDKKF